MSVHGQPANVCPYCLKRFESRQAVTQHQKRKKHRVEDRHQDAPAEKAMRRLHDDRIKGAALSKLKGDRLAGGGQHG